MFEQLHGNKITALYCRLSRDENTAPYVRLMFQLALEGATTYRIAVVLRNEKAPKPSAYIRDSDGGFHLSEKVEYPYDWNAKTVSDIIRVCGITCG